MHYSKDLALPIICLHLQRNKTVTHILRIETKVGRIHFQLARFQLFDLADMVKRNASRELVGIWKDGIGPLCCHSPPRSEFNDEDGYLRREFDSLPKEERERLVKDIYGIGNKDMDEDPTFITECLYKLDHELSCVSVKKEGFEIARDEHAAYFENENFRLKFLRAEKYNPKLAAKRIVGHFEQKLNLFGPDKIGREITIDDLDSDDMDALMAGGLQLLPMKDRGGRKIIFARSQNWKYKETKNMLRVMWYINMCSVEDDPEAQKNGVVTVIYNLGSFSSDVFNRSLLKDSTNLSKVLPVKVVGLHFCFDDIRFRMMWGVNIMFLGKAMRLRSRDHEGTHAECRYGLMSYGIPVNHLPMSIDGEESRDTLTTFIEERRGKESSRGGPLS